MFEFIGHFLEACDGDEGVVVVLDKRWGLDEQLIVTGDSELVELSTKLRAVSQCPEMAPIPTRAFCLRLLNACLALCLRS